jgi:RNA polymerase sigma factor (sigma-70 family)
VVQIRGGAVFCFGAARPSGVTRLAPAVHVIDDDPSFRKAICRVLRLSGYDAVEYESGAQFLEQPLDDVAHGCILLDVRMPGLTGLQFQDRLAERGSTLPIVYLTGHGDIPSSVRAIKAGAEDFLTKPVPEAELIAAIERALSRDHSQTERRAQLNAANALLATLTPRERQVFDLVVRGKMSKEIGHELGATERTIKAHRKRVMEKLRMKTVAALVLLAERPGILEKLSTPKPAAPTGSTETSASGSTTGPEASRNPFQPRTFSRDR